MESPLVQGFLHGLDLSLCFCLLLQKVFGLFLIVKKIDVDDILIAGDSLSFLWLGRALLQGPALRSNGWLACNEASGGSMHFLM